MFDGYHSHPGVRTVDLKVIEDRLHHRCAAIGEYK